jgi:hypothetical protein
VLQVEHGGQQAQLSSLVQDVVFLVHGLVVFHRATICFSLIFCIMKVIDRLLIGVLVCFGLFAVHQLVGGFVSVHKWPQLNASDWGTWTGSIGTLLTWIWTIRLATADKRDAKKQASDRAVVAAAALVPRLQIIAATLQNAVETILDFTNEIPAVAYRVHADQIAKVGNWSDEEILPLIVLPGHVCARLAGVRPVLLEAIAELREIHDTYPYSWVQEELGKRRGAIVASLVTSRDTVQFAVEECLRTVQAAVRA